METQNFLSVYAIMQNEKSRTAACSARQYSKGENIFIAPLKTKQRTTAATRFICLLAALVIIGACFGQVNLNSGLVAYYPFSGNANDYSGNNNHGTPSGSAALAADQAGNASSAYSFNGTTAWGKITVPNSASLQFTTAATFSFWLRVNSATGTSGTGNVVTGGQHSIFAKDADAGGGLYSQCYISGGAFNTFVGNVGMTNISGSLSSYTTGQWLHYVYVMDATEQRLYINNNLVSTVAGAPNFATMNTKALVMARMNNNWYPLNGTLDEFRVYNRALNAAEIAALYTNTANTLSIDNISATTACAGAVLSLDYSSTGTFAPGNVFSVQFSDASGSFAYPVTAATFTSSANNGTLNFTVPQGMPSGSNYKVRLAASAPAAYDTSALTLNIDGVLGDIPSAASFRYAGNAAGKDYYITTTNQTYAAATTLCGNNGGVMGVIPNAAANSLIANAIPSAGSYFGYTDVAAEGTWVWADGNAYSYTNWNAGEPNNSGNEDYGIIYTSGKWNDMIGTSSITAVMTLRPAYSNSPVCEGSTITLFGATLAGAAYQWSGPAGFSSTQQNPVIPNCTAAMGGTYTLTITKGSCSASVTTDITVNQSPVSSGTSALLSSLSSGLILHYPMDGNANDASGNLLHGTISGGVTAYADRFGNPNGALKFNGTNGYIDAPDAVYFNGGDFTVSAWVREFSYKSWSRLFDFGNGQANNNVLLALSQGTNGRPQGEVYLNTTSGGTAASGATTIPLNAWTHIVFTYTSGTGRVYRNNAQIASGTITAPQNILRTLNYIARSNWSGDAYADAAFDDFRIYDRALTSMEIKSLYMEQQDPVNLIASPAAICPGTASSIKITASQPGVSYQLQNAGTGTNIGAAQNGTGDTLSFATGNLSANTNFQLVATAASGCSVTIGPVAVNIISTSAAPVTTGASRCEPGSVTLGASGAPAGADYTWYTVATGGTSIHTGSTYTTPTLSTTTTYYVAIFVNGCETNRTPVTATINLATAPAVDLYSNLLVHLKMDGNLADSSGNGINGTVGTGTYVNDRLGNAGKALDVTANNYVDCGNPGLIQQLTTQVTVSIWIKERYVGSGSPLVNKWQNNGLYLGLDGYFTGTQQNRVRWRIDAGTYVNSSVNVPFNTWHHIVATYDGSTLKVYQNGALTGSAAYNGVITNTITNLQIGRQANGLGSVIFDGAYDDVRIYNRALNADEAMALYNNGMAAFSNAPLCEGETLQLSSPAITGATYSWSGPNGFTSSQQNPSAITNVTMNEAGTYSLVINNPNGCTSSVQTNDVVVNIVPSAPFTVNDTVCGSGNALLLSSAGMSGASYGWYAGAAGGASLDSDSSFTVNNLAATDTFYVSAISSAGCEGPRSEVIAVYNNPVQQNLTVSGDAVCSGTASADITVQSSQNIISYQAYEGSAAVSAAVTGNGGTLTIPVNTSSMAGGNHTIVIHATQPGCGTVNLTDTATITIIDPVVPVISPSGTINLCSGDSVVLSSSAAPAYLWSEGTMAQTLTVTTAGTYSVMTDDANGCTAASAPVIVNVDAPVSVSISAGSSLSFCQGSGVTLTAAGAASYAWSNAAAVNPVTITTAGNWYAVGYSANGACTDTSNVLTTVVLSLPNVTIDLDAIDTLCTSDAAVQLTGESPAGGVYSGAGVSGTMFDPQSLAAGNYLVTYTYTDANSCSNSASQLIYLDACLGISNSNVNEVSLFPNPVREVIYLRWNNAEDFTLLELFDAAGRLVLSETLTGINASPEVSGLEAGIYMIRLSGKKNFAQRFVKE